MLGQGPPAPSLLAAFAIRAPRAARDPIAMPPLDVVVDARQQHREQGGGDEPPDLEEDETEATDEATTHATTLASRVPRDRCDDLAFDGGARHARGRYAVTGGRTTGSVWSARGTSSTDARAGRPMCSYAMSSASSTSTAARSFARRTTSGASEAATMTRQCCSVSATITARCS